MFQSGWIRFLSIAVVACAVLPHAGGCGKKKTGLTIAQRLEKAEKEPTPDRQAAGFLRVAKLQAGQNQRDAAKETAMKAFERLKGEGDANLFAQRLVECGAVLAELGERKPAREALALAIGQADKVDDPVRKTQLLADAGAVYGDKAKGAADSLAAKEALKKATEVADGVEERFRADALAAVALGSEKTPLISRARATELLGTMLGGYNIHPLIELLGDATVGTIAADALKKTLLMFDAFHDVDEKAKKEAEKSGKFLAKGVNASQPGVPRRGNASGCRAKIDRAWRESSSIRRISSSTLSK